MNIHIHTSFSKLNFLFLKQSTTKTIIKAKNLTFYCLLWKGWNRASGPQTYEQTHEKVIRSNTAKMINACLHSADRSGATATRYDLPLTSDIHTSHHLAITFPVFHAFASNVTTGRHNTLFVLVLSSPTDRWSSWLKYYHMVMKDVGERAWGLLKKTLLFRGSRDKQSHEAQGQGSSNTCKLGLRLD